MSLSLESQSSKKIELIDQFRARFSVEDNEKLALPQIIVVGDQSSGKSSILEAISQIKLPRGIGTVTKCPIIIQMRKSTHIRTQIQYRQSEFREITDVVSEIHEVQKTTFRGQITKDPITLSVEAPYVPTLTIIDLPGLVKSKAKDHMDDIVTKTHDIAEHYMRQQNSLIICVLPANQDICTTTIVELATKCNPDKSRIIGVLTKIDKIDEKDATILPSIFRNEKLELRKGYYYGLIVGDDILAMDSANRARKEENVFRNLNLWKDYKNQLGLQRFEKVLANELDVLIDKTLPELKMTIDNLIMETDQELSLFSKYYGDEDQQHRYVEQLLRNVEKTAEHVLALAECNICHYGSLVTFIEDNNYLEKVDPFDTFLYFWNKIFNGLYLDFQKAFQTLFKCKKSKYYHASFLEKLMEKWRTENLIFFDSPGVFKRIVKEVLDILQAETNNCVDKCYTIIYHMVDTVLVVDVEDQLQKMRADMKTTCHQILQRQRAQVNAQLEYLFTSETFYFSQDMIVAEYDKEDKAKAATAATTPVSVTQQATKQIMGSPQTMFQAGHQLATYSPIGNNPLSPGGQATTDTKSDDNGKCQYPNGQRLKDYLEKYLGNLIRRLGDVVPNFIRLGLFVNFKESLVPEMRSQLFHYRRLSSYFSISPEEQQRWNSLKDRKKELSVSAVQLERFSHNDDIPVHQWP